MERHRRRRPTMPHLHPRSLKYVPADRTHVADPADITVATTMDARGHRGTHVSYKPVRYVPGIPRDSTDIRMSASGRPPHTPAGNGAPRSRGRAGGVSGAR